MVPPRLIPNEKRILTLLAKNGRLSKRDIERFSGLGWATVVKLIGRLEKRGYIHRAGIVERPSMGGVKPESYVLSRRNPLAVGIDVEYTSTRIHLTNLMLEELATRQIPTPRLGGVDEAVEFLEGLYQSFIREALSPGETIAGIGVGFPTWLVPSGFDTFELLERKLEERMSTRVRVDNNVRAYTAFKYASSAGIPNFILVTIRSGIGVGIVLDGKLFRGTAGKAGEISHFVVVKEGGNLCRCGKRGCLETVVNQNILVEEYRKRKGGQDRDIPLQRIFDEVLGGDEEAQQILDAASRNLAYALSALILSINVDRVYLAGHFGETGSIFGTRVEDYLNDLLYPHSSVSIQYEDIEDSGFPLGAAMMILQDYCDFSMREGL
ncbi:MAG: ROK family transcriptional regulator [Spirochaetales bacterium]